MTEYKKLHFTGIGGIGMSALAQYFHDHDVEVTGSDRAPSPVTELLETKGIRVMIGHSKDNLPRRFDALVYSDAVPEDNPERAVATEDGIPQFSYFEMLGQVSEGKRTVAVAGTHGKTTTTGMLANLLIDAGASPTAIVGSLVKDFGSNYVQGTSDLFVVEACEYRDHLLELTPEILIITNLEWDHTDYFPSLAALQETFRKAIANVPAHGRLITNPGDPNIAPLLSSATCSIVDYTKEPTYSLLLPGEFNQMNARAAAAAVRTVLPTIAEDVLIGSLAHFKGTWRRFEFRGQTENGSDVYDDYAHHPTAVAKTLATLKSQTKGKVWVAFHPHLYSRTKDLFEEFASAFSAADKVIIAPIYAAREVDDGSVSNAKLAAAIAAHGVDAVALDSFDEIKTALEAAQKNDVIMTMGAGDIYKVADKLIKK